MTSDLKVKGMSCNHCAMAVKNALKEIDGVHDAAVDLTGGSVSVSHTGTLDMAKVRKAITEAGFELG